MTDFFNPPQEIIDAANKLTLWASENNLTNWCINGVAGRWPILPRKGEVYLSEPEMRKVFLRLQTAEQCAAAIRARTT